MMRTAPTDLETTYAILDDGSGNGCWLLQRPSALVVCTDPDDVGPCLATIEAAVAEGLTAAGFFAYELGYILETKLHALLPPQRAVPLLAVGLYAGVQWLPRIEARAWLAARAGTPATVILLPATMDPQAYDAAFAAVRAFIAAGDVYQINLTFKQRLQVMGDPAALYLDLQRRQRVGQGGLLALPGLHILSLSPELFVDLADNRAVVRPMKGTAARGITQEDDRRRAVWLAADGKSRAENLMIVDLMRNDLGRLATMGGVRVSDLYTVETLRTLHQMTSGIEATLRPDVSFTQLLAAIFPCGSVTGAPKIRAMQIIRTLETEPRGVYTGAIGMIRRDDRGVLAVRLNVAIRTLMIGAGGTGELGIGSGIVFDSEAAAEYDECLLKARFLTNPAAPFGLIETLRWEPVDGYSLLDRHLDRLAASAVFFVVPYDKQATQQRLDESAAEFGDTAMRVRLTLSEDGKMTVTAEPLAPLPTRLRYALSPNLQRSDDPFRYHKTTQRTAYETELSRLKTVTGCDEVLFVNERGELTEGSWTNLFIRRGGALFTPPAGSGLLPGTLRAALLASGEALETVLYPVDLAAAEAVFLGNSVRGLLEAEPAPGIGSAAGDGRTAGGE